MYRKELRIAISLAGSQAKLAIKLDVSRSVINHWLNRAIVIPVEKALLAEVIFEGKVLAEDLSPENRVEILSFKKYWRKKVKTDA
jgi:DNA-binding transcriptional regulator YdaS (Cro superfamily)